MKNRSFLIAITKREQNRINSGELILFLSSIDLFENESAVLIKIYA